MSRICVLDDSPDILPIVEVLSNNYEVSLTDDYRDIADWISEDSNYFDIFILDLVLPS